MKKILKTLGGIIRSESETSNATESSLWRPATSSYGFPYSLAVSGQFFSESVVVETEVGSVELVIFRCIYLQFLWVSFRYFYNISMYFVYLCI